MALWLDLNLFKSRIGITDCNSDSLLVGILKGVQSSISGAIQSPVLQVQRSEGYWLGGSGTMEAVLSERPVYIGNVTDLHVYVVNEPYQTPTADDEITYQVNFDFEGSEDPLAGADYRWSGILQRVDGNIWPCAWRRQVSRLSSSVGSLPRIIRVVGLNVGWLQQDIPSAITEAAYFEAAARYAMRKTGWGLLQSESWNGYSYTNSMNPYPGMELYGAPRFASPITTELLAPYMSACVAAMR